MPTWREIHAPQSAATASGWSPVGLNFDVSLKSCSAIAPPARAGRRIRASGGFLQRLEREALLFERGKSRLAHTLNGSALALPRVMAALIENNQTPEGIIVPEVLRPYTGFDIIG